MTNLQILIDQKVALESEIARTLKAAEERKKKLEEEIVRQRAEEIMKGRAEIQRVMQEYNLSPEEALGAEPAGARAPSISGKKTGYLSEIRKYYSGRIT